MEMGHTQELDSHCVCPAGLPVLKGYVAARRGEREEMQDAHVLLPDMSSCLTSLPGNV